MKIRITYNNIYSATNVTQTFRKLKPAKKWVKQLIPEKPIIGEFYALDPHKIGCIQTNIKAKYLFD